MTFDATTDNGYKEFETIVAVTGDRAVSWLARSAESIWVPAASEIGHRETHTVAPEHSAAATHDPNDKSYLLWLDLIRARAHAANQATRPAPRGKSRHRKGGEPFAAIYTDEVSILNAQMPHLQPN